MKTHRGLWAPARERADGRPKTAGLEALPSGPVLAPAPLLLATRSVRLRGEKIEEGASNGKWNLRSDRTQVSHFLTTSCPRGVQPAYLQAVL